MNSELFERMDMGGMSMGGSNTSSPTQAACKISMLWNWYTIDSCFIARSWHVRSKGAFAGSCIGVFFLVMASQWLARFAKEYELALVKRNQPPVEDSPSSSSLEKGAEYSAPLSGRNSQGSIFGPLIQTLSHNWLFQAPETDLFNHSIKSLIFAVEWGLSYLIMLLFMYYNGYIIISCILGALFGKFFFGMREPLRGEEEVSCCKH